MLINMFHVSGFCIFSLKGSTFEAIFHLLYSRALDDRIFYNVVGLVQVAD